MEAYRIAAASGRCLKTTVTFIQPLIVAIRILSARLQDFRGDSTDRMIVATALVLQQPLVSADGEIIRWFGDHQERANMLIEIWILQPRRLSLAPFYR